MVWRRVVVFSMLLGAACAFPSLDGLGPSDAALEALPDVSTDASPGDADAAVDAPRDAPRSVTLVQSVPLAYALAPSMSQQLPSAVASGDFIAAVMASHNPNSTPSFSATDTLGNTWLSTPLHQCAYASAGTRIFYVESSNAGVDTVAVSQSPAPPPDAGGIYELGLAVFEYAGVASTNTLDVEDGICASVATTLMASPSITTTSTDMLMGVFVDPCGQGTMTPGIGWKAEDVYAPYFYMMEDELGAGHSGAPPGSYQATGTDPNTSQCWVSAIAAFRLR